MSRLLAIGHNLGGVAVTHDQTLNFIYNPASQIFTRESTNDLYAWTAGENVSRVRDHSWREYRYDRSKNWRSPGPRAYK